jgi:photosystem II stability/assembly factor-like uncharacterized protein
MRLVLLILALFVVTGDLLAQSTWRPLARPNDEDLMAVQFFDIDRGYVVARSGLFLRTMDGGKTWEQNLISVPKPFSRIDAQNMFFLDSLIGVVTGSLDTMNGIVPDPRATLFWTYDGGKSWDVQMFEEVGAIAFIQFLDRKFAYFATTENQGFGKSSVYYTNGGGFRTELWQKRTAFPSPQRIRGMAFEDNVTGLISGDDPLIIPSNLYLTSDEGMTWSTFVGDQGGSSSSFDALHWTPDGVLATCGSRIMQSLDSGHTWGTVASMAGSAHYKGFSFVDDKTGFALPYFSGQVLKTTNGGFAWQVQQIPEALLLFDMWAIDEDNAYAVGNSGSIFKLSAPASVQSPLARVPSISVFPNPARTYLAIKVNSAQHSRRGHIYDRLGREALLFVVESDGITNVDIRALPAGAYSIVVDGLVRSVVIE